MSRSVTLAALIGAVALSCATARAEPLFAFLAPAAPTQLAPQTAALAPADDEDQAPVDARLRRQIVNYSGQEAPGTIIVDTPNTYLYFVLGNGKALRYGIGVGREGFTWSGSEKVSRMAEWPDWNPPEQMIERQPYLPRFMAGGDGNPLGARALYLGDTLFRIHGTNQPSTIGTFVSSGCIRLTNEDIMDLYKRVKVGTRVVVLPGRGQATAVTTGAGSSAATASRDKPPGVPSSSDLSTKRLPAKRTAEPAQDAPKRIVEGEAAAVREPAPASKGHQDAAGFEE